MTSKAKPKLAECFYCLRTKPLSEFNREHVLPEAFGKFRDSLVVHEGVCEDCNKYFGETLDRVLGRESIEGLLRYQTGLKSPEEAGKFKTGRVRMKVDQPGPLRGANVRPILAPDGKSLGVGTDEQVSITDPETGAVSWYALEEVKEPGWAKRAGVRAGLGLGVHASDKATEERIYALLRSIGLQFSIDESQETARSEHGSVRVAVAVRLDDDQFRAAAKIAFNYLAAVYGNALALEACFNDLRAYVRYGVRPPIQLVYPSLRSMVDGEPEGKIGGRVMAHLLSVGWSDPPDMLVGQVAVLNSIQYRIILTPRYPGVRRPMEGGHAYNLGDMRVTKMKALRVDA